MRYIIALLSAILLSASALTGFEGPTAAPVSTVTKASDALKATEDAHCILEGKIVNHLGKDRYTFEDASGSLVVNIPPHVFGPRVTPQNTVRLVGEMGGIRFPDRRAPHLRVRYLEVLK